METCAKSLVERYPEHPYLEGTSQMANRQLVCCHVYMGPTHQNLLIKTCSKTGIVAVMIDLKCIQHCRLRRGLLILSSNSVLPLD